MMNKQIHEYEVLRVTGNLVKRLKSDVPLK